MTVSNSSLGPKYSFPISPSKQEDWVDPVSDSWPLLGNWLPVTSPPCVNPFPLNASQLPIWSPDTPAPSPLGAIIIPRVSSALWIPQSRESHESICHHSPPWELRRAESQASGQSTSVSLCASPVLLVNPWRSPAGKSTKNTGITNLSLLPTHAPYPSSCAFCSLSQA